MRTIGKMTLAALARRSLRRRLSAGEFEGTWKVTDPRARRSRIVLAADGTATVDSEKA